MGSEQSNPLAPKISSLARNRWFFLAKSDICEGSRKLNMKKSRTIQLTVVAALSVARAQQAR